MTGLDTNILVRYLTQDDPAQCIRVDFAMASLSAAEPGFVSSAAWLELVWVLGRTYRNTKAEILMVLEQLLSQKEIVVEQAETVRRAIQMYRRNRVSFADCLISASAASAGCSKTLTFDEDAAKSRGMTLIP